MKYKLYYLKLTEMNAQEFVKMHLVSGACQPQAERYDFIAELTAENHEEIFSRFQSDDKALRDTVGIDCRSMMVGDILIDESGKGYLCRSLGWQEFDSIACGFSLSGK